MIESHVVSHIRFHVDSGYAVHIRMYVVTHSNGEDECTQHERLHTLAHNGVQVIATAQHIGYGHFMMVVAEDKLCGSLARAFEKLGCVHYNASVIYRKTPLLKNMIW